MDSNMLSGAVISHVGGSALAPPQRPTEELQRLAEALVAESLLVHAQWNTTTSNGARVVVKGTMRRRHAELSEEALDALALNYLKTWRLGAS